MFETSLVVVGAISSVATAVIAGMGYVMVRKQWRGDALHREHLELLNPEIREALRIVFAADPLEFLDRADLRLRDAAEKVLDMYDLIGLRVKAGTIPKSQTIDSEWPTVLRAAQQLGHFVDQEARERKTDYKEGFKWFVSELRRSTKVRRRLGSGKLHACTNLPEVPVVPLRGYRNSRPCVAIVVVSNHKFLLLQRATDPGKNMWELPGGFLDDGEDPYNAALREIKEETEFELEPRSVKLSGLCTGKYESERASYHTLNICYRASLTSNFPSEPEPRLDPKESIAYAWCSLDTLINHSDNTYPLAFPWMADVIRECVKKLLVSATV